MAAVQKRKYEKPMIKFVTDMNIILECLYEVYGQEEHHVLEGKDIQKNDDFSIPEDVRESVQWNYCKSDT